MNVRKSKATQDISDFLRVTQQDCRQMQRDVQDQQLLSLPTNTTCRDFYLQISIYDDLLLPKLLINNVQHIFGTSIPLPAPQPQQSSAPQKQTASAFARPRLGRLTTFAKRAALLTQSGHTTIPVIHSPLRRSL